MSLECLKQGVKKIDAREAGSNKKLGGHCVMCDFIILSPSITRLNR